MKTLFSLIQSVLAAAFGVQSEGKRRKDFQQSSPKQLIAIGITFLIIFIFTVIFIVKLVLP
ncbi:DUF2970 domain-containing protein [Pseudoalteromonas denitrificans]|jgi:hypothetical protein|uniref:DUF2970 domain-containing protein n=1 Tax=Pseudoalteromonas denitrificans DSM 6059 TaxID=1123010 RepID=A0A1I1JX64_9GAMM|nr:DUF2970 domain-containing protein [Pseudoalteromonas denitrificans]SFC53086.1 Protein of unknown function [Pseudoalteromonas denitrificans DSM 6059]